MRCIFCKSKSNNSKSVEHIIPESLGNKDHILPVGVVCDKCNNYIAREIEKPLLDSPYFKHMRFNGVIPNKRNLIPPIDGIHLQSLTHIQLHRSSREDGTIISPALHVDGVPWIKSLLESKKGFLIIPVPSIPDEYIMSRFIAKVGLEVLVYRVIGVEGWKEEIIDKKELNELRNYVRLGSPLNIWPFSYRSIYSPEKIFSENGQSYQVLHEFDILVTPENEYYIVVVIFGDEFALNLGGREMEGYYKWLKENNHQSPLYTEKNAVGRLDGGNETQQF